ncbi:MAG: MFS transporter [Pseudomonadales bacterium]
MSDPEPSPGTSAAAGAVNAPPHAPDPAYGWVMVAAVFVLSALSFGALGSVSVFLKPLSAEFGWTRAETALGYTTISFASALFGILWGIVADRYGTRWFGLAAATAMTLCLCLLSQQQSIVQFYAFYFLFGAFGNAMVSAPLFANVGFWFRNNPGLALGITASGGAFGQGLVPYIVGRVITDQGWESAYLWMAGCYFIIALPFALLIRESPWRQQVRLQNSPPAKDFPLSDWQVVIWISGAIIFCCNCMAVPIVHLVPLLTDRGHSLEFATGTLMVLMFCGVAGRIMGGKLGDSIGALPGYMIMSLGQTISVFWFTQVNSTAGLYALAAFFGFTYSGVMSSILVCTRMMVSANFGGRAMAITSFFGWTGMGLGGFFGGLFYDIHGNYSLSFGFAAMMGVINLIILSAFYLRIQRARQDLIPAGALG